MKYLLIKLKYFVKLIFISKKKFLPPKKSDVLIYDINSLHLVQKYFLKFTIETLSVRAEEINLFILFRYLRKIFKKNFNYKDEFINYVQPKIIVSSIDNDIGIYKIKQKHKDKKIIVIQNGWRDSTDIFQHLKVYNNTNELSADHILTFTEIVSQEYRKYIQSNYLAIGSVKSNEIELKTNYNSNTISYISQWGSKAFCENSVCRTILVFLKKYALKNNKNLKIILRNNFNDRLLDQEIDYFSSILGYRIKEGKDFEKLNQYISCDNSEIVVGADSTLCYESLGRGNKTAIFSIRDEVLKQNGFYKYGLSKKDYGYPGGFSFGWPSSFEDIGFFWTNKLNEDIFTNILDDLFSVDIDDWKQLLLEHNISELMPYDFENLKFKQFFIDNLQL